MYERHNIYAIAYHSVSKATLKIISNGKSFHARHRKELLPKKRKIERKKKSKLCKGSWRP